jgi:uncharacterized protein
MRHAGRTLLAGLIACLFCVWPVLAAPTFPALTGRVVDDAGILSAATRGQLADLLAATEQKTGDQVVVVTLKSLQGYEIDDYGYQLGRAWGIGQKGKNNGALLIVAPNEHRVRIEVGYGLEGDLTDAQSRVIIERLITPAFKKGDFDGGVMAGTRAIVGVLGGDPNALPQDATAGAPAQDDHFGIPIFWIILLLFFIFGRGAFWPLLFMSSGRGWGGGGGSRWGGDDGFSGGGGSFGGGGASGRW